jgi:hypothetical protein
MTEEEIALILNSEEGPRARMEEQRKMGRALRQQGTLGGGVRAPGIFVAESPFAAIGDLMSRYSGRRDEKAAIGELEGIEGRENDARSRAAAMIAAMRGDRGGQGAGGPQMSPVPPQGGPPQGGPPLTQFGNPNQSQGARTFPMPEQSPMGPMTPIPPQAMTPPINPAVAPQASPVGPPSTTPPPQAGGFAGLSPQEMQKIQQWLGTLRR